MAKEKVKALCCAAKITLSSNAFAAFEQQMAQFLTENDDKHKPGHEESECWGDRWNKKHFQARAGEYYSKKKNKDILELYMNYKKQLLYIK